MELVTSLIAIIGSLIGFIIGLVSSASKIGKMNELIIRIDTRLESVEELKEDMTEQKRLTEQLFERMREVEKKQAVIESKEDRRSK